MSEKNDKAKKPLRADVIVISALLLLSLLLLFFTLAFKEKGAVAVVEINGAVAGEYPLSQNGVFVLNGGTNTLVIENGAAYLTDSHCPDKTCELTGKVRYVGQTVICLPNRLSVTVKGESRDGVDLVS